MKDDSAAKSLRTARRLALDQASFEITGNSVFAWRAINYCLRYGVDIPGWTITFLKRIAGMFEAIALKEKLTEKEKIGVAIDFLKLRPAAHTFNRFDAVQQGHRLATLIAISQPGSPIKYLNNDGKPGLRLNRARLAAMAESSGSLTRTAVKERLVLANKIEKRAVQILKNGG